ncbi:glutamine--fructose-6-phosphate transaminase (isomerizing) [Bartonella sp. HY329]|uniref:glutamine--fructose-6-phosphate transaminase (isomerizing) n=1 Tax=unclassified Bartonella TaxID=2645622 RepID=UPI0021C67429|nr:MULTISPECIES: glutamine--fructose-6-phosphate transaminase (isomerizing) [unclassified Bartonella]UXM94252.1 glutamine--fructose-6-phosphate transaminase (isomerizing) [Bartonella sp. HY329]UXN08575.1 glutamine--fructose-6-phosphate transaminase (isomerizing) [Bartonella sp. HY328]
MCGIIGILGTRPVAPLLIDGLKRLEYRGYDSAGVATLENGILKRMRAEGKLVNLEEKSKSHPLAGTTGIGHTRWATHGMPVEKNAHPHMTEQVAVVHNGIIENFSELKAELSAKGYEFKTETDTETVAYLVEELLKAGNTPKDAVEKALKRLNGAFALAFIFKGEDNLMIAARQGPPLAIGYGDGEMYVGSDAIALAPFTDRISYLEDGDFAVLTHDSVKIYDGEGNEVERTETRATGASFLVSKGNHRHFMRKEMFEQPEVISHTLANYLDLAKGKIRTLEGIDWKKISRLSFASCGTAFYSTLVAKYWFENLARLPIDNDIASEFRYREPPLDPNTLALFVSQSGETADTLACLRYCRQQNIATGAVVNVAHSTMAREADRVFPTLAGAEIGVASTKAFTCQLAALAALAINAGVERGVIDAKKEQELVKILAETPRFINQALKLEKSVEAICTELMSVKHVLYLGRGTSYPIALEGALKLKELSYIHAEGYAAGELKHGPIALIDETMPVIVVAPYDRWFEKTVSNMQEVAARGGRIILITDQKGKEAANMKTLATLVMPEVPDLIAPLVYAVPIQLIAYHTALLLGTDVDQPRNLAKAVTVE